MITDKDCIIIEENEKFVTYQFNKPILDEKGYPTWKYDDQDADIITIVKHPLWDSHKDDKTT